MASYTDLTKGLLGNLTFTYRYDVGFHYFEPRFSQDIETIRNGQDIVYTPYAGTNLAFYLNLLYRQSATQFTLNFTRFVEMFVPTWRDLSSIEIMIQLEVWVITETERHKLRILESQYENAIRTALQNS